jgi:hypothetical protein
MPHRLSRRSLVRAALAVPVAARMRQVRAESAPAPFAYPIGVPGETPGNGFLIRVGYACENLPSFPGWWHTGENWHLIEGETAGAEVYAAATGDVVFAGYDYPGPVVIVRHAPNLYSMYGHLDYALDVAAGDRVERGQRLGTVLQRTDAASHLHFELRTFLEVARINGDAPEYGVHCGVDCPPGPGYWPMAAPEHPSDLGWRNPVHAIARRAFPDGVVPAGSDVMVAAGAVESIPVWSAPDDAGGARQLDRLEGHPGDRYPLLQVDAGEEATTGTSAESYRLWYQIGLPDGSPAWVRAAVPSTLATGADGRPSSVRFAFVPAAMPVAT